VYFLLLVDSNTLLTSLTLLMLCFLCFPFHIFVYSLLLEAKIRGA
jgi:hypothetical protein